MLGINNKLPHAGHLQAVLQKIHKAGLVEDLGTGAEGGSVYVCPSCISSLLSHKALEGIPLIYHKPSLT